VKVREHDHGVYVEVGRNLLSGSSLFEKESGNGAGRRTQQGVKEEMVEGKGKP